MRRASIPALGPLPLTIVVAASLGNGIGAQGALPWRVAKDMAYFRAATNHVLNTPRDDAVMREAGWQRSTAPVKNAVIMGRTTWESIPARFRPLRGRINVVVSTTMDEQGFNGVDTLLVRSFEEAVTVLQQRRVARYDTGVQTAGAALAHAFVIGGAALYRYVLEQSNEAWTLENMLVTRLLHPETLDASCDVFLQEFRTPPQQAWEAQLAANVARKLPTETQCADALDPNAPWRHAVPEEHRVFLGDAPHAVDVGKLVEENGVVMQFQLWRHRM
ncbi:dihydrofolate reductase [Malassezia vespertilionis]|uniref:Dihydrofolate reductase n=1 Tax=Malassezia vespertilionis TaxID=2020962 RepID=A0A2N1JF40_9BASI|nr:dihydrofolate reductase [Malassezia vespertilionis]PKI85172.1 Dfr1p [Malassezia vespertilionis]WFD05483.1 dihydrofolate reductase [Malassezia vespertilionis]